jgi:DNA adenine methylase
MSKIKSPLRYPGGKSRAIAQILPLLPTQIKEYREPFVGGGSVYLAIRQLFGNYISRYWINDLNRDVYYFWVECRDNLEALVAEVQHFKDEYTNGRELYEFLRDDTHMQTDFERAVRFFIMNRITFSGVMDAGGYSEQAFVKRFTQSSIQRLEKLDQWLKNTHITPDDYASLLEAEGEDIFIFLDPPYLSATDSRLYGVRGNLHTSFDHVRFAKTMQRCPHRWLITYDDSPEIRELFSFATIINWQLQYGMNNSAEKSNELFIKNY